MARAARLSERVLLLPLLSILWVSFTYEGTPGFGAIFEVLRSAYFRNIFVFTLGQAIISTGLTLILALPIAYVFAESAFLAEISCSPWPRCPSCCPTIVVATAFSALLGPRGLINDLLVSGLNLDARQSSSREHWGRLYWCTCSTTFPCPTLDRGLLDNRSPQIEEAARVLGGHGWKIWWHIRLPFLRPVLLASALWSSASHSPVLASSGSRRSALTPRSSGDLPSSHQLLQLPIAASLSLQQIGGIATLMIFYTRFQKRLRPNLGRPVSSHHHPEHVVRGSL